MTVAWLDRRVHEFDSNSILTRNNTNGGPSGFIPTKRIIIIHGTKINRSTIEIRPRERVYDWIVGFPFICRWVCLCRLKGPAIQLEHRADRHRTRPGTGSTLLEIPARRRTHCLHHGTTAIWAGPSKRKCRTFTNTRACRAGVVVADVPGECSVYQFYRIIGFWRAGQVRVVRPIRAAPVSAAALYSRKTVAEDLETIRDDRPKVIDVVVFLPFSDAEKLIFLLYTLNVSYLIVATTMLMFYKTGKKIDKIQ